jgi:hypothetical protein
VTAAHGQVEDVEPRQVVQARSLDPDVVHHTPRAELGVATEVTAAPAPSPARHRSHAGWARAPRGPIPLDLV